MSDATERFKARKARLAALPSPGPVAVPAGDPGSPGDVDQDLVDRLASDTVVADLSVAQREVDQLLRELAEGFNRNRLDGMLDECKRGVVAALAGPFGLGRVVSKYDKIGGNVDTVHNVREGVWATDTEKAKFDSRGEYDTVAYHEHESYIAQNAESSAKFKSQDGVQDAYSDRMLKKSQGDSKAQDHIHSARATHDDAGIYLAELDPVAVANRKENLTPTSHSVNSAKGQKSPNQFADDLDRARPARDARINQLENTPSLSDGERKELARLHQQSQVDTDKLRKAGEQSKKDRDEHVNSTYYGSAKFAVNVAKTGAIEGARMGMQQAFGEALAEFMLAAIDEVRDWYKSSRREAMLMMRLRRIAKRVTAKWKTYGQVALGGLLTGFLSNLVTVCINMIVTTQKRLVRMIREGVFSLARAMKMLVMPPEGLTLIQAAHEATKLAFAGGILIGGIAVEEILMAQLQTMGLGFIAEMAVTVIVGTLTAVAMALSAYSLDRLDLFGAVAMQHDIAATEVLDASIRASAASIESLLVEHSARA